MTPDEAAIYLATFAGRTDAWQDWPRGARHWQPRREPLTPAIVADHWEQRIPLGLYFLADERTHVLALDFDAPDGLTLARRVGATAWRYGLPAYLEPSRRGAHLWMVTNERLRASLLRAALRALLRDAEVPEAPTVELRPGSDHVPPDGLGHALRAPMQPHPATGERHALTDPRTGGPLGATMAEVLLAVDQAPARVVRALGETYAPPAPPRPLTPALHPEDGPIARFNAATGVSAVLIREWGLERAAPGRNVRCPAHDDRSPSLSIARDDSRAWCHSPGCPFEAGGHGVDPYDVWRLAPGRTGAAA